MVALRAGPGRRVSSTAKAAAASSRRPDAASAMARLSSRSRRDSHATRPKQAAMKAGPRNAAPPRAATLPQPSAPMVAAPSQRRALARRLRRGSTTSPRSSSAITSPTEAALSERARRKRTGGAGARRARALVCCSLMPLGFKYNQDLPHAFPARIRAGADAGPDRGRGVPVVRHGRRRRDVRLGGVDGIRAVVDELVSRSAADPRIHEFFVNTDFRRFKSQLVIQLCEFSGGPCRYRGRSMRDVHPRLRIRSAHFEAMLQDASAALRTLKVGVRERHELLAILRALKPEIVEQAR